MANWLHVWLTSSTLSIVDSNSSDFKRSALACCVSWKLEKLCRNTTPSIKSKIQHFNTTCITAFLYGCESWVISRDMENKINSFATSCYSHSQHQVKWPHTKCHDLHYDRHKTTTAASKIPATEISWTHTSNARWRTGKNICPLCANACVLVASIFPTTQSHVEYLLGDKEIAFDTANIASLAKGCSG